MSAPSHPFTMPYVGLGLLDEASIRLDGENWIADYPIGDDPYLTIAVGPDRVEFLEVEDGSIVARTVETTLERALGFHGIGALDCEISRFWRRVAEGAGSVWVLLSMPETRYAYVPAIGFGQLCVPSPLGIPWVTPEPGPLARRLGFEPFDPTDPATTVTACLLRRVEGEPELRREEVRLHGTELPGILVGETVAAIYAANGPLRGREWRPFVNPSPADWEFQRWRATDPAQLPDGGMLLEFALLRGGCSSGRARDLRVDDGRSAGRARDGE